MRWPIGTCCDADRRLSTVFEQLRQDAPPFDATMRTVLDAVVDHPKRPALARATAPDGRPSVVQLDELRGFEDRICDEAAFHLKRCDCGGDDVEMTAQTLVHAIDAQLHRVMTHGDSTSRRCGSAPTGSLHHRHERAAQLSQAGLFDREGAAVLQHDEFRGA